MSENITEQERKTTAQAFADMVHDIEHYDGIDNYGKTIDELKAEFEACKEIVGTLTKRDMLMLWYMRHAGRGTSHRFMLAARKAYEVRVALDDIENV